MNFYILKRSSKIIYKATHLSFLGFLHFVRYNISFRVCGLRTLDVELRFWSIFSRNIVSSIMSHIILPGSNDFIFWIVKELAPVS